MYRGSMCSNMILSYHFNPLCMNLLFLTHKFLIFLLDSHWLEVVQTWSRLSFKFRHRHDPLAVCIKSTEEAIWLPQYIPCLKVFREPWTSGFKTISKNGHLRVWYVSKPIAFLWNLNVSNIDCCLFHVKWRSALNLPGPLPFILGTQVIRPAIATDKACITPTAILSASMTFVNWDDFVFHKLALEGAFVYPNYS